MYKEHHKFQCDECGKTFCTKGKMKEHQKTDHKTEPQKCLVCPAVVKNIALHMRDCHTRELKTCTACSYSSRRKHDIESHFRKMHTMLDVEMCKVCGNIFKNLKKHMDRKICGKGK